MAEFTKRFLPKKLTDISEWYNKLVLMAELADYGPAKGTMIFRPYGYRIWELVQKEMDQAIKAKGVENAYFPLFIPESLLNKEKEHVAGFSPELAVVTIGGGEELSERLIVRPTSETIMYNAYAKWVQSWRDLPILINQWNNVVRWEKRTYLFLRTSEFLWQEGHTAHISHEQSWEFVEWAMKMYAKTYQSLFAIPGLIGKKSESEKFPGAVTTLTYESLMPGGKALQSCTSHDLGQNFSKPFNIEYLDKNGEKQFAWQTSWGLSTRSIGGLILTHGDDQGLKIPPKIAPIQVVILPVHFDDYVINYCHHIETDLKNAGIRILVDDRDDETLGYRINKWEIKGVPIRLEIGKKETDLSQVTVARRDNSHKTAVSANSLDQQIIKILDDIQNNLYQDAVNYLSQNTFDVQNYDQFKEIMNSTRGFIKAFWCEDPICEAKIKEETKASTRCLPLDSIEEFGKCVYCQKDAKYKWYFAISY